MKSIIGKKLGMTQIFSASGELVPVTVIEVEPNLVVGIKTLETHSYSAVVVGYKDCRESLLTKPVLGQFKKQNLPVKKNIAELRDLVVEGLKVGDFLKLSEFFKIGNLVDVQGITRGHGFTGAIKLWNFATGPKTHGAGYPHRYQGSLETGRGGAAAQKVWKGKKMSGRYGNDTVTMPNLEVVYIDEEKHLLFVRGAVPGRKNRYVKIKTTTRPKKSLAIPFEIFTNKPKEPTTAESAE